MAGFGGAVKLTGESAYRKALQQCTQNLKELSSEMKVVSSQYSSADKSEEALTAKTNVLNKTLAEQTNKLNTLKAQYASMEKELDAQTQKHDALVKTYNDAKAKLEEIGRTLGTTSKEYKEQESRVVDLANQVRKSSNAQDENARSMSKMRSEINLAQVDCNNTAQAVKSLGDETEESAKEAEKASNGGYTTFRNMLANLASSTITAVVSGLKQMSTAIVNVGKQALNSYAEAEQLEGGIKKLFGTGGMSAEEYAESVGEIPDKVRKSYLAMKDAQEKVIENANNAYKTAGLSANEYMKTVTSFSASLISGLNGDTTKAVDLADMAIRDMADNANTYGQGIDQVMNAYQGLAKQNFTMIDNLRLGYGGNAGEMARLINDSGVLGKSMEVTEKTVKNVSFDKMIEAIHVIQERMHITKTTANEASGTIQGSAGAMSAAWKNLVTGMADDSADFSTLVNNFVSSLMTMLGNTLPRIKTIIRGIGDVAKQLMETIVPEIVAIVPDIINETLPLLLKTIIDVANKLITDVLPQIAPIISDLLPQAVQLIIEALPLVIDAGIKIILALITGLKEALPKLLGMIPDLVKEICGVILTDVPLVIQTAFSLIDALVTGLKDALPVLIGYVPEIVEKFCEFLINNVPYIIETVISIIITIIDIIRQNSVLLTAMVYDIFEKIATAFTDNADILVDGAIKILFAIINGFLDNKQSILDMVHAIAEEMLKRFVVAIPKFKEMGKNLLNGIVEGFKNALPDLKEKLTVVKDKIVKYFNDAFQIKSPSKVMENEVGKYLAQGIGVGFTDEMRDVTADMANAIPRSFDYSTGVTGSRTAVSAYEDMVGAFKDALSQMKIELDDEVAGHFVEQTVTRIIYD